MILCVWEVLSGRLKTNGGIITACMRYGFALCQKRAGGLGICRFQTASRPVCRLAAHFCFLLGKRPSEKLFYFSDGLSPLKERINALPVYI